MMLDSFARLALLSVTSSCSFAIVHNIIYYTPLMYPVSSSKHCHRTLVNYVEQPNAELAVRFVRCLAETCCTLRVDDR